MNFIHNKVFKNASWIIVCKIGQAILSLIVTMISARYLGPSGYGVINYAAALVTFMTPLAQLGLCNIQVQEYINSPEDEGKILGSSILLSLISSLGCVVGVVSFAYITNYNNTETVIVCAIYSILLLLQGAELMQYWFQYKYQSKYYSVISIIAYVIMSCYKIFLLASEKSILWFAFSNSIDYFLILILSYVVYKRLGGRPLKFSKDTCKQMFSKSKYYIFSSLMVVIFTQTDKIMLNELIDSKAAGIYSAASNITNLANFVFIAIIDSLRPQIFESYKVSKELFEKKIKLLHAIIIFLTLSMCIVVTFTGSLMVKIIYGATYLDAVTPLSVLVWYNIFSFLGMTRNVWILAENKQKWLWLINTAGAVSNVLLNFILIPIVGVVGAAVASLVSQIVSNIIVSYLIPDIRPGIKLIFKSLNFKGVLADNMRKN